MYSELLTENTVSIESICKMIKIFDGYVIWIRTGPNKNIPSDLDFFSQNLNLLIKKSILVTSDRSVPGSYKDETVNKILLIYYQIHIRI